MTNVRTTLVAMSALILFVAACAGGLVASPSPSPVPVPVTSPGASGGKIGISGIATAGPVCPVVRNPPDPGCAARPVGGAVIVVRDPAGSEVARTTTAAEGSFFVELGPGGYVVEPQAVNGLMGTAPPQNVTVQDGMVSRIQLDYDTGIR